MKVLKDTFQQSFNFHNSWVRKKKEKKEKTYMYIHKYKYTHAYKHTYICKHIKTHIRIYAVDDYKTKLNLIGD